MNTPCQPPLSLPPLLPACRLAAWTGGEWDGAPTDVRGVSQNGRDVPPGGLYVALRGARHDGHAFVVQAAAAGAAAALVARAWTRPAGVTLPLLRVDDPLAALAAAAAGWRRDSGVFVLGLTGSAGKTTTKELTASMLAAFAPAYATPGNLNNAVGLPLTLLAMPSEARFGVIEAGTNHPGEIAALADVMAPDAAMVTAIGSAHIEFFGSLAAIADEKAGLLRRVPARGFVVLSADDPFFDYLRCQTAARVVTVSMSGEADFTARQEEPPEGGVRVIERASGETCLLCSGLPGRHNALNLLLAAAAARSLHAPWEAIAAGAARVRLPPMRWERIAAGDITLINDAYNANALSMACALETFRSLSVSGRRVLVLGEMRELGAASEAIHREIGRLVAGGPWQALVTVGACARWLADEAVTHGFPAARVHGYEDAAAAAADRRAWTQPGDTILLKASRGVQLEQVAAALTGR